MREIVIVLSDFYPPASAAASLTGAGQGFAGLASASRFGRSTPIRAGWRTWLAQWFGRADLATAPPASVAAAALDLAAPRAGTLWLADPVHLIASLRSVHLDFGGLLRLDASTLARLAESFETTFADSHFRLIPLASGRFVAMGPELPPARTDEPSRWLGSSIEGALPSGAGGAALQRLAGEIEMWLHEHPLNVQRAREQLRPVSTLWLWGGGAPVAAGSASPDSVSAARWIFGDDPFAQGLVRLTGGSPRPVPERLSDVLGAGIDRAAVVLEAFRAPAESPLASPAAKAWQAATPLQALEEMDRRWFAPAFEAVAGGRLERLSIVANDRCLAVRSRDRWKFWRRGRGAFSGLQ